MIAEIYFFMELKYALTNDKPTMETGTEVLLRWEETQALLLTYSILCHIQLFPLHAVRVNLYSQCYHQGPPYFSYFMSLSCSPIG